MKTLFAFSTWYDGFNIVELEIVKETPKQYVVKSIYGSPFNDHVNKSRMEIGHTHYFETKEKAVQGLKDYCHEAIGFAENKIARENEAIAKYKKILARLEEGKQ